MSDEINVIVIDRGRKNLYLRYTDPVTGQKVEKSARTSKKREAVKRAGEWQAELANGLAKKNANLKWSVFRESYEEHVLATLADTTHAKVVGMFNIVDEFMKPDSVRRVCAQWVSRFQKELLQSGREPSTVESHCRHLKAAMNWAKGQGLVSTVPQFNRLKKAKSKKVMKGRPITGEEFDRMILAADRLPEQQRDSLKFFLRGLWLSGLRISEAMCLTWDQWADGIRVDISGKYTKLLIPSESEKGGQDRIYPVTPDFAEFLLAVPNDQRAGLVFNVVTKRGITRRADTASKLVVRLGEKASIKVDEIKGKTSYASAHDLRRAFGMRWARRVMPMVLKELMRHDSVTTTEKYYVDIDADGTAALLAGLSVKGDTLVDTSQEAESPQRA